MMHEEQVVAFKSGTVDVLRVVLGCADLKRLQRSLEGQLARSPSFFQGEGVFLDARAWPEAHAFDWVAFTKLLEGYGIQVMGVLAVNPTVVRAAQAVGFSVLGSSDLDREKEKLLALRETALILDRALRSGQRVYADGGDVVALETVNEGAEIIADGNIHVYAPLRGRALAGASGAVSARVFSACFAAELVAVAGVYEAFGEGIPTALCGHPVQVRLDQKPEGSTVIVERMSFR